MSRFNKAGTHRNKNNTQSVIKTKSEKTAVNHYGAEGYVRKNKAELYLLAASFMGGDSNFYETSDVRYKRLNDLVSKVAVKDPEWLLGCIEYVRTEMRMRTVSGVMAADAAKARLEWYKTLDEKERTSADNWIRKWVDAACQRPDEPQELLAYWLSKYGKPIPYSVKKGLGDAATRLYTERAYLRYGAAHNAAVKMRDIIYLCHPQPKDDEQSELFAYILGKREEADPTILFKIHKRNELNAMPKSKRRILDDDSFQVAEMDHRTISSWLGKMDKAAWEAVIPNMGVMALLMNLNNFDKNGISDEFVEKHVIPRITDVEEIKRSRVFPMNFLSAFRNVGNLRWSYALEKGLNNCLVNVPELDRRNLILIDVSPSMTMSTVSKKSELTLLDAAAIFGAVLKHKSPMSNLVQFGGQSNEISVKPGTSVLTISQMFKIISYTDIPSAVSHHYDGQDRVIIVTDEQSTGWGWATNMFEENMTSVRNMIPSDVPIYTWNLAGYKVAHQPSGWDNMHVMGGGFSDACFSTIHHIEKGLSSKDKWPWE